MSKVLTISMAENDLKEIDAYCTMHELTRSKFMVQSALEKVQQESVANSLIMLCDYLSKTGNLDILSEKDRDVIMAMSRAGYINGK